MTANTSADHKPAVRLYITVFVALMALTLITVGVSYLHLAIGQAIIVAMIVATVKGGLVAMYFMHLITEKKLIGLVLAFMLFCLAGMIIIMLIAQQTEHVF